MNNDLISREALKEALGKSTVTIIGYGKAVFLDKAYKIIDNAPTVEAKQGEWIPITMRPGTDEEYEDFCRYGDCPREDFRVFDCPTPDDEQEVFVTTRWGNVCIDIWHRDVDCCYFEDNCDDGDVIAWMPIPKPYKESEADK